MGVTWKISPAYTQYLKEIDSEVREFDFTGRVAGGRVCRSKRRRESEVIEVRDRGKQWATRGSFGLQRREPTQTLRRLTQSSAGTAQRNTQIGTRANKG